MSDAPDFRISTRGEPDSAIPRFYVEALQNKAASDAKGSPVFYEREMVEILIPGDRNSVPHAIVKDEHKQRWPAHYDAFKRGLETPVDGTPLEMWPGCPRPQVEELKFAHIRTVEQVAALSDIQLNKTVSIGGFALRAAAVRYLELAAGSAPMEKLAAENAEKDAKIATLEAQHADLLKRVDAMAAQAANGPAPTT